MPPTLLLRCEAIRPEVKTDSWPLLHCIGIPTIAYPILPKSGYASPSSEIPLPQYNIKYFWLLSAQFQHLQTAINMAKPLILEPNHAPTTFLFYCHPNPPLQVFLLQGYTLLMYLS